MTITKEHELKAWPDMFAPMASGEKPFDVRRNDRGFQKGDVVWLREWDPNRPEYDHSEPTTPISELPPVRTKPFVPRRYTGRECRMLITYVLSGWGIAPEHVVLGYLKLANGSDYVASEGAQFVGKKVGEL